MPVYMIRFVPFLRLSGVRYAQVRPTSYALYQLFKLIFDLYVSLIDIAWGFSSLFL